MHTDASDYQLGAVITQNDKPLAFFSRKLKSAQCWYTKMEQELLSIVEMLKEYKNIFWKQKNIVKKVYRKDLYNPLH